MKKKAPRIVSTDEARERLEALCAKAEHCEWELRRKLALWKISADDAERIIAHLRDARFVDDSRFARAFVWDKFRFAGWGRRKIEAALRMRRIPADTVCIAIEEGIDAAEYAAACEALVRRRIATAKDADSYEGRTRIFRTVASRGFEPELVARTLRLIYSQK